MGLTPDQIQALMATNRTKGEYSTALGQFLKSAEEGIDVFEVFPHLRGDGTDPAKRANTVKQGFENAKNAKNAPDGSDNVKVIKSENDVYLINLALSGVSAE